MFKGLLIIALSLCLKGSSQEHYNIIYANGGLDSVENIVRAKYKSLLIIYGNSSYESVIPTYGKIKEPFGAKFSSHSIYSNYTEGITLSQSQPYGHPKYMVMDTIHKINWQIEQGMKEIVGYNCNAASGTVNGRDVLVFYTTQLPAFFGPLKFTGLPGTILEIQWKGTRSITTVIEIKKGGYKFEKPDDGKLISMQKYTKILENLYKNQPKIIFRRY